LINLLTVALRIGKNGSVDLNAATKMENVQIRITSIPASDAEILDTTELLSVTQQLVELSQGVLEIQYQNRRGVFEANLILPALQRVTVLVIDDNQDTLLLLERYLAGSRFQFAGGRDPSQMLALIEKYHPGIIVLDVMLPGTDGWELLSRLKGSSETRQIPVIISTILPQKSLALMFGAADFLRKPFTQVQLLEALEQQVDQPIPKSN
jgi:CheY-like chemotaxis protein